MCPEQTLKRNNIDKIMGRSVASTEIAAQQKELKSTERRLERAGDSLQKIKDKVEQTRQRLAEIRNQHRVKKTKQTQQALSSTNSRLQKLRQDHDEKRMEYRELKNIVREQRIIVKSLEKKEVEKQKAVARFLKDWERAYDRKMRLAKSNIQKRRRTL